MLGKQKLMFTPLKMKKKKKNSRIGEIYDMNINNGRKLVFSLKLNKNKTHLINFSFERFKNKNFLYLFRNYCKYRLLQWWKPKLK